MPGFINPVSYFYYHSTRRKQGAFCSAKFGFIIMILVRQLTVSYVGQTCGHGGMSIDRLGYRTTCIVSPAKRVRHHLSFPFRTKFCTAIIHWAGCNPTRAIRTALVCWFGLQHLAFCWNQCNLAWWKHGYWPANHLYRRGSSFWHFLLLGWSLSF